MNTKTKIIICSVAGVVVIAGAAAAINRTKIANSWRRLTMSPEEYTRYVLTESSNDWIDGYFERVNNVTGDDDKHFSGTASISASEDFIDEAENYTDNSDYLENFNVNFDAVKSEGNYKISVSLLNPEASDDETAMTLEYIIDPENELIYGRIPEANEEYLKVDTSEYGINQITLTAIGGMCTEISDGNSAESQELVKKYTAIILGVIDDVDEDTETLEVEDVSQRFTALTFTVDNDVLEDMVNAVADEMEEDEDLKNLIVSRLEDSEIEDYIEDFDAEDIYDNAIDSMKDFDGDDWPDIDIETVLYVNSEGEIKGFSMDGNGIELRFLQARHFTSYGLDTGIDIGFFEATFSGEGKWSFGKISGVFNLDIEDLGDFDITIDDLVVNSRKASGTVSFNLEELFDTFGLTGDSLNFFEDMVMEVEFNSTSDNYLYDITLDNGDDETAEASINVDILNDEAKVDIPSDSDCTTDSEEYADDCEWDGIEDALRDIGFTRSQVNSMIATFSGEED